MSPKEPFDHRLSLGRQRPEASFPVGASSAHLPADYKNVLSELKERIRRERLKVTLSANTSMTLMYWDIGRVILERQAQEGWGAKVIDRLSEDLKHSFPEMSGLSARNLKYMRKFAEAWPESIVVQRSVAQIPWRSNLTLLEKLEDSRLRLWYAQQVIVNGWSKDVLAMQIDNRLHERQGKALNNFQELLPPADSDMASQVFKDPYLFDFLGTADPRREREVEKALVEHVKEFLMELGHGFAFVGSQMHLEVGNEDFYPDLVFYHLKLRRFVVVELKAVPFEPGFVGQLNLYLSAVDDLLKHESDGPTIGLLLCKSKNEVVVEYALKGLSQPMGVADWETQLVEKLPEELRGSLPTVEEIEAELGDGK